LTNNDFDARREAILQDALRLARRRRQRRVALRVSLATLPLVLLATVLASRREKTSPHITIVPPDTRLKLERIADDPDILNRYRLASRPSAIERIDDATLLADLREANIPGGIAIIGDQTYVLLQDDSLDVGHE
jgi:hypothetical protein